MFFVVVFPSFLGNYFAFFPAFPRYNQHITLGKLKVYNVMIYILIYFKIAMKCYLTLLLHHVITISFFGENS